VKASWCNQRALPMPFALLSLPLLFFVAIVTMARAEAIITWVNRHHAPTTSCTQPRPKSIVIVKLAAVQMQQCDQ
jgi:hypothetical protein